MAATVAPAEDLRTKSVAVMVLACTASLKVAVTAVPADRPWRPRRGLGGHGRAGPVVNDQENAAAMGVPELLWILLRVAV